MVPAGGARSQAEMPRRWLEVSYGAEERSVFVGRDGRGGLVHALSAWRTVPALAAESGLAEQRVREILAQYAVQGVVIHQPQADWWAYWERLAR